MCWADLKRIIVSDEGMTKQSSWYIGKYSIHTDSKNVPLRITGDSAASFEFPLY
jgi:hypothetical protein